MWRFPIQNHLKPPIPEKERNKAKYLTKTSIRLTFVKKTRMPNSVKSLGYIKCYSSSSLISAKSPSNSIRNNCQLIFSWLRRCKTILEIRKKAKFTLGDKKYYIYKLFKDFKNQWKKTKKAVVFHSGIFPKNLKYRDRWWDLPTIWKTMLF